jgi:hypothetical protein
MMILTAEQCRAYAAEHQRLGLEADISIHRLGAMELVGVPRAKEADLKPMEV